MSKEKFDYFIKGDKGKYEVVIGLEVHAQVLSKSKLFSGSSTKFGADPNNQVSLIDSAFPGMLPVINEECVKQAVRTGLGLNAKINNYSVFDRKNYFYADLPQGYQISQYKNPIVGEGKVLLDMPYGSKEIGIERLHLEQDAGKSIHDMDPSNTYVDLNRSGIALMEIVSKPDLRSPEEVNAYVKKLRSIMRYLGTCDGNMQEGSLRADVNVSVRKEGDKNFGTRCEIKNVNSIKFMQMAITHEAKRQVELLESGKSIDDRQILALSILVLTFGLFLSSGFNGLTLGTCAMIGGILMHATGVLEWEDSRQRLRWGVMFIYGAALTMGKAMVNHGAADWLAGGLYQLANYGSEYGGDLSIILIIVVVTVLLTNVMSDGAAAAILVPITLAVGAAAEFNLAFIAIITAISTAFAFMTSFGTPPNLIVQASGIPTSNDFLRNGVPLVIIAILFLILAQTYYWGTASEVPGI